MIEFKRDILKTREIVSEAFSQCINEANKLWYGVLRLIITLSSSFLVLSIALVEKLFPPTNSTINLPKLLIMSWILLFSSIIFGIIAELEAAVFHGNLARAKGRAIHELNQKIAQGIKEDTIRIEDDTDYLVPGKIIWGAISINCFIFAILCMCLALVSKIILSNTCVAILILASIFIVFINIYLIRKRENKQIK
jgi:hypothetical protein